MRGHVQLGSLQLALVEETQTGAEEGDDGRGSVLVGSKGGRGPRLVMVLEEAGRVLLERQSGP